MKRRMLDVATFGSFLFTTLVLMKAGWLSAAHSAAPQQAEMQAPADAYGTQSAMRYRRCQEDHWRACILQR